METVRAAVASGATLVQLRDPDISARTLVEQARALKDMLQPHGVPLIVNDRVDVAKAAGADGVHLGQDDLAPRDARGMLGPDAIIGLSVGNAREYEASRAELAAVDYLGVGPINGTRTKSDAGVAIGLAGFAAVRALTPLPMVAIGGVNASDAVQLVQAGAEGLAVISAICAASDPGAAAAQLRHVIGTARINQ